MKLSSLKYVLNSLGYSTNAWIEIPKIVRITLASNSTFYFEDTRGIKCEYYFDTENNLFYKRNVDRKTGDVINIVAIVDIDEISHIETLNAHSVSMFNGNSYLRKGE